MLAVCLLAFAVSPITAPFTTCDLTDFTRSQPADSAGHHPGRQLAEAHARVSRHLVTIAFELTPGLPVRVDEGARLVLHDENSTPTRRDLRTVLRL